MEAMHEFCAPGSEIVVVTKDKLVLDRKELKGVNVKTVSEGRGRRAEERGQGKGTRDKEGRDRGARAEGPAVRLQRS